MVIVTRPEIQQPHRLVLLLPAEAVLRSTQSILDQHLAIRAVRRRATFRLQYQQVVPSRQLQPILVIGYGKLHQSDLSY